MELVYSMLLHWRHGCQLLGALCGSGQYRHYNKLSKNVSRSPFAEKRLFKIAHASQDISNWELVLWIVFIARNKRRLKTFY
jgi:hypothetical protein